MDRINAADVQTFSRVARSESFRIAANQLGVTRSAVSKSIGRLEKALGVRLLNRSTRSCSLTDAGRRFLKYATKVDVALEAAVDSVSGNEQEVAGHLGVSVATSFGAALMPSLVERFRVAWPRLKLSMHFDERYIDLIGTGIDVAIRIAPQLEDSTLLSQRLGQTRMALVASPGYLAKYGVPKHPRELKSHRCLDIASPLRPQTIWRFRDIDEPIEVPIHCSLTANADMPLILAACMGDGILYTQRLLVGGELAQGRLVPILSDYTRSDSWGIYAVYPNRRPSAKVRAFIEFVRAELRGLEMVDRWAPFGQPCEDERTAIAS